MASFADEMENCDQPGWGFMKKWIIVLATCSVAVIAVVVTLVASWYAIIGTARSYALRAYDVPRGASNAILHAYAGAETYATFRKAGFGKRRAEVWTVRLGYGNEWFEHIVKRMDSTAEVYKDLHNNHYGITAARWLEDNNQSSSASNRLRLIAWLAKEKAIPWWPGNLEIKLSQDVFDPLPAIQLYKVNRADIVREASSLLNDRAMAIAAVLAR
ncbi:MAG: hypothetical protein ACRCWF_03335 [Beijerinckiaceae bacterium]